MTIPESVRALIATGPNAHLTTLNADGSPEITVVWVGIDNDELVIGHMGVWHKVKNVRRDPRVALSMLARGKNAIGLQQYLVVYGKARITEGGAPVLLQRLAHVYLGPNGEFPPAPDRTSRDTSRALLHNGSPAWVRGVLLNCSGKDAADRQARESFVAVAAPIGVAGHMT